MNKKLSGLVTIVGWGMILVAYILGIYFDIKVPIPPLMCLFAITGLSTGVFLHNIGLKLF